MESCCFWWSGPLMAATAPLWDGMRAECGRRGAGEGSQRVLADGNQLNLDVDEFGTPISPLLRDTPHVAPCHTPSSTPASDT